MHFRGSRYIRLLGFDSKGRTRERSLNLGKGIVCRNTGVVGLCGLGRTVPHHVRNRVRPRGRIDGFAGARDRSILDRKNNTTRVSLPLSQRKPATRGPGASRWRDVRERLAARRASSLLARRWPEGLSLRHTPQEDVNLGQFPSARRGTLCRSGTILI